MKRVFFTLTALAMLAGCATSPEKIVGIHNTGACTSADRTKLATLYQQQKKAATSDAIGVLLIGVPVASLGGADRETEIAVLKGRCS